MRRLSAGILATGIISAVLLVGQVVSPASACGCGGIVPLPDSTTTVTSESAIVHWDGTTETMVISLDMLSDVGDAGLIVPTPSPATVTAGDRALFTVLSETIEPRVTITDDWWGSSVFTAGRHAGTAPQVISQVRLGPVEATTLKASDSAGLKAWLDSHGYTISFAMQDLIQSYVQDGWSFVALRLTNENSLTGSLDPIQFSFATDHLIYPLRLSQAATTEQRVRLYVLDDHRTLVIPSNRSSPELDSDIETVWAGRVNDARLTPLGTYLTVIDLYFDTPAAQITSDLDIIVAGTNEEIIPTVDKYRIVTVFGIPVGVLVAAWVVLGLGILAVFMLRRLRSA